MKNVKQTLLTSIVFVFFGHLSVLMAQPPANDQCSGAVAVGTLPWLSARTNVANATTAGDPPAPSCQANIARSIWFTFTPASSGDYYISTCLADAPTSTMPDIVLGLYTSTGGCGGPFTEVTCDDDGCDLQSVISSVALTGGTTYYIVAWQYCNGCSAPTGANRFIRLLVRSIMPPSNDDCATATDLGTGVGISTTGNNFDASASGAGDVSCDIGGGGLPDVWYSFTTDASGGDASIVVGGTGMDIVMATYSSCGGTETGCADGFFAGTNETINLTGLAANTTVYLRVYEYDGLSGSFNINISGTALPLELASFTGKIQSASNMLLWETLTEKNVQWHIVERSVDGVKWSETGKKAGQMASYQTVQYELEDRAPLAKAYYRLRSVDYDGTENLSGTISLTRKGEHFGITAAFPSPTKDQVTVQLASLTEENVTIRVTDFTGRLVLVQEFAADNGINEVPVQLGSLQAGVYLLSVSNATSTAEPMRIVKE